MNETGSAPNGRHVVVRTVLILGSAATVATFLAVRSLFLSIGNDEAYIDIAVSVFWQAGAAAAVIAGIVAAARAGKRAPALLTLIGCVAVLAIASMLWAHAYYATATAYVP